MGDCGDHNQAKEGVEGEVEFDRCQLAEFHDGHNGAEQVDLEHGPRAQGTEPAEEWPQISRTAA